MSDTETMTKVKDLRKIIYIDDDKEIQPLIQLGLRDITSLEETKFLTSGRLALKVVPKFQPDLIFLDVMMPDMDGIEVLEHLQKDPSTKDIPVVFITAKDRDSEITALKKFGGVEVITKPFDIKNFHDLIMDIWKRINEG